MSRESFKTLTEQMYYILLCLIEECSGTDIMGKVSEITGGRVNIGPGTCYNLLERFLDADMISIINVDGRKKTYRITDTGRQALEEENARLRQQLRDYELLVK